MLDLLLSMPTFHGLSAGSSAAERFLDPTDKPRDVGSVKSQTSLYFKENYVG